MEHAAKRAGLSSARLQRIDDLLQGQYVDKGKIAGCQMLVSRRGHVAYRKSFGAMNIATGARYDDETIVRIYSMTKPITSVALMMLFERGLFQLDDPVTRIFPEWASHKVWTGGAGEAMSLAEPQRAISFRDILCHTAGLTYGGLLETVGVPGSGDPVDAVYKSHKIRGEATETLDQFIGKLGRVPLRYHPGEQWMYSLATDVCGAAVERLSGKTLDVFFEEEIFAPLGMKDTAFHVSPDKAHRLAANYARNADKSLRLIEDPAKSPYLRPPAFLSGGGGLASTLEDYRRFCEMLRRGGELDGARIIGRRTLAMMTKNHLKGGALLTEMAIDSFSETASKGVGFGLGFAMTTDEVKAGVLGEGDYYWGGAASTIFWVDPREDLVAVFLTQLIPSSTFNFRGQLKNIIYSAIVD